MAAVSGPVSTLPGHCSAPPEGAACDDHPDRLATKRIQGETDSFGAEYHDLCDECAQAIAASDSGTEGRCDWCKTHAANRRPIRDIDEGQCGPVYYVCQPCRDRYTVSLGAELDALDDGWWD